MKKRCDWVNLENSLYIHYHDEEWGVPIHSDQKLFEFLILEGCQAGLSWLTILKKRENYRQAYDGFDPKIVAGYDEEKIQELLNNPGIVRNRLKILATIENAKQFLRIQEEHGSFDKYIWSFVKGKPIVNNFKEMKEIPAKTEVSDEMSKALKKEGFKFCGSTICYAFMQAAGLVNDHTLDCFRRS